MENPGSGSYRIQIRQKPGLDPVYPDLDPVNPDPDLDKPDPESVAAVSAGSGKLWILSHFLSDNLGSGQTGSSTGWCRI